MGYTSRSHCSAQVMRSSYGTDIHLNNYATSVASTTEANGDLEPWNDCVSSSSKISQHERPGAVSTPIPGKKHHFAWDQVSLSPVPSISGAQDSNLPSVCSDSDFLCRNRFHQIKSWSTMESTRTYSDSYEILENSIHKNEKESTLAVNFVQEQVALKISNNPNNTYSSHASSESNSKVIATNKELDEMEDKKKKYKATMIEPEANVLCVVNLPSHDENDNATECSKNTVLYKNKVAKWLFSNDEHSMSEEENIKNLQDINSPHMLKKCSLKQRKIVKETKNVEAKNNKKKNIQEITNLQEVLTSKKNVPSKKLTFCGHQKYKARKDNKKENKNLILDVTAECTKKQNKAETEGSSLMDIKIRDQIEWCFLESVPRPSKRKIVYIGPEKILQLTASSVTPTLQRDRDGQYDDHNFFNFKVQQVYTQSYLHYMP